MINLIQDSILKDTSFISHLKGTLITDDFEKLRFYTESDVRLFGQLLELRVLGFFEEKSFSEKEYAQISEQVNSELLESINRLVEYLGDSELYINADYVKEGALKNPPLFTLTEEQKQLSDNDFALCIRQSFQQEMANFMLERADYYKNLDAPACLHVINQSTRFHHEADKNKASMAKVTPPMPTEKRSTAYPRELIDKIGGEERFEQLLRSFANDSSFFQEVKEENGAIHCKIKDEEGILWNITVELDDNIKITLANASTISKQKSPDERFEKSPGAINSTIELNANTLPSGAYQYSVVTIQDLLTTKIKQLATMGMMQFHMMMNDFPDEVAEAMLHGLFSSCPTRQEIPNLVNHISQSMMMVQGLLAAARLSFALVDDENSEVQSNREELLAVNQNLEEPAAEEEQQVAPVTPLRQLRRTRSSSAATANEAAHTTANATKRRK